MLETFLRGLWEITAIFRQVYNTFANPFNPLSHHGFAFVPELFALRVASSHQAWPWGGHMGDQHVSSAIRNGSRSFETIVEFPPSSPGSFGGGLSPYGLQFLGAVSITYDPASRSVAGMALNLPEGQGPRFHCFVDAIAVECVVSNQTNHSYYDGLYCVVGEWRCGRWLSDAQPGSIVGAEQS